MRQSSWPGVHSLSVMPGRGDEALLRADVPGIHVLALFPQERRGWAGRNPALNEAGKARATSAKTRFALIPGHDGERIARDIGTKQSLLASPGHDGEAIKPPELAPASPDRSMSGRVRFRARP